MLAKISNLWRLDCWVDSKGIVLCWTEIEVSAQNYPFRTVPRNHASDGGRWEPAQHAEHSLGISTLGRSAQHLSVAWGEGVWVWWVWRVVWEWYRLYWGFIWSERSRWCLTVHLWQHLLTVLLASRKLELQQSTQTCPNVWRDHPHTPPPFGQTTWSATITTRSWSLLLQSLCASLPKAFKDHVGSAKVFDRWDLLWMGNPNIEQNWQIPFLKVED